MVKKSEIQHPLHLEVIRSSTDRNKLIDTYFRRLIAEAIEHGWNVSNDSVLRKQKNRVDTKNLKIQEKLNKEKTEKEELILAEIEKHLLRKMGIEIPDERESDLWLRYRWNEKITFTKKDKLGKTEYQIRTTPKELVEVSFLKALLSLPNPITNSKQFDEALHNQYNNYVVHQNFPTDASKPQHQFRLRLKWRI